MRLLLDTHTLIWSADHPAHLTPAAIASLQDPANELLISAASLWELAIKIGQQKIALSMPLLQWIASAIEDLHLGIVPVTPEYAERLSKLPPFHKDPFDRLIIAQSLVTGYPVVGVDAAFDAYGVVRIW